MSAEEIAPNSRPSLTLSVLTLYFAETADMLTYLSRRIEPVDGNHIGSVSEHLLRDMDTPAYRDFIRTSYVSKTSKVDNAGKQLFKAYPPMIYMREVIPQNNSGHCSNYLTVHPKLIDKAQEKLFAKAKGKSPNIITSGYRLVRGPPL